MQTVQWDPEVIATVVEVRERTEGKKTKRGKERGSLDQQPRGRIL